MLSPVALQVSVDYLKTEDFARRPLAWLDLISRNPGTSLSYSRPSATTFARAE
jgi:fatty-acyl-CoA synthase